MGRPKNMRKTTRRPADAEDRWFEVYRELREELRAAPDLVDYNPVIELAKLGMRNDIGPALKFLCHKEVASYTYPRLESRGLAQAQPAALAPPTAPGTRVTRFLPTAGGAR